MRRFLLGVTAGVMAGYTIYRSMQSLRALQQPAEPLPKDPAAYGALRRNLELTGTMRSVAVSMAICAGGAAHAFGRTFQRGPVALRPAWFALTGLLVSAAIELPAAFIEEYELERRYGLSDQTARAWFIDHAKGAALGAGVMAILSIPFAALLRKQPNSWPIWATMGLAPLFVLAGLVVPVYIAPLFNTFEPLTGALETRLRALAARFGVGDAAILRVDMSRQTKKANAYVTGMFATHRIVIGDTLLKTFPDAEIEFVVAHELGHYITADSWRMSGLGVAATGIVFLLANLTMPQAKRDRYDEPAVIYELFMWITIFSTCMRPAISAFSRSREWAADRFALAATGEGATGAAAFTRLREQNLAEDEVPRWYEILFSTHPSLGARIKTLESAATM
ncbi:MAG: M48 family metallopeptidase [Candidatus Eremiobacteraeota bacterium]|nr:M48 family metallopeptidase [Candidatus Eremiobacteraeota bacterium]